MKLNTNNLFCIRYIAGGSGARPSLCQYVKVIHFFLILEIILRPAASFLQPLHDTQDGVQQTVVYTSKVLSDPSKYAAIAAAGLKDFVNAPDKSRLPQKEYTWEELASQDGADGRKLLLVINGKVYDFTDFAVYHPAGPEVLKKYVGRDATIVFRECGVPRWLEDAALKMFRVGWVKDYQAGQYETPRPDNITTFNVPFLG
ncbi:uncharacterized protein LOC125489411 isoform X2 [Plutella xylostella]|uniref:uncharacterized protein LOC125489411 isoform X2 n=1 Tax=Plutella xylostella TaxID=51655 RepID=UPI002032CB11|nr:uncharacterized protein LOC125489411 isoform X2 [Plutella xylostella]